MLVLNWPTAEICSRMAQHKCDVCSAKLQFLILLSIVYFDKLMRHVKNPKVYTSVILPGELNSTTLSINYNITCRYMANQKLPECDVKRLRA